MEDRNFIPDAALAQYGENAARLLNVSGSMSAFELRRQIISAEKSLKKRRSAILKAAGSAEPSPAQRWLADNYYLCSRQAQAALEELSGIKQLPCSGLAAAVVSLCRTLLRSGEGTFTAGRFETFFTGCGLSYILNRSELDAMYSALNAAVIFEIADSPLTDETEAKNLFTTLRFLSDSGLSPMIQKIDAVEQTLSADPSGDYPRMSEKTRWHYRRRVALIAKKQGFSELRAAQNAVTQASLSVGERRHVGFWLFPFLEKKFHKRAVAYIALLSGLTLAASGLTGYLTGSWAAFSLTHLPYFELIKLVLDRLITVLLPPRHLPRMDEEQVSSSEGKTLCVVSALLTSPEGCKNLESRLEQHKLANRECGDNLLFGLLADLPDSKTAVSPSDAAVLDAARLAVERLNAKYGGGFFLFTRPRRFSKADRIFSARERKRGAILALCRLLSGLSSELEITAGSALALHGVKLLLTLDEDTRLTPGSASKLIGAMLHPLNRPVFDPLKRRIVSGYGILQPRMTPELKAVNASPFSRLFAGQGGVDPYGGDVSEVYFDAFTSGGFSGKGIIDIAAFLQCMDGTLPENRVLSHDALEGAYLRGGLMADVELSDSFPSEVLSYHRRAHRWIRGDWQNLPWLLRRGKNLSLIERFRLFDSARRSLMPVVVFLCLALAFFIPTRALSAAAVIAFLSYGAALLSAAVEALFRREGERCRRVSCVPGAAQTAYSQLLFKALLLPFEAYVCLSAALTALWRMLISRKKLLRWTTSAAAASRKTGPLRYFGALWFSWLFGALVLAFAPAVLGKALGVCWIMSPLFAGEACLGAKKAPLSSDARDFLNTQSLKMWRYFAENCTPNEHFLPPDNLQERPPKGLAHRTSPTNIGLALLCCLAAADLGLCPDDEAFSLAEGMLNTIINLPKWHGHLLNWYDTRTLSPLRPECVSTVDSGNLAVCLEIARQGFEEYGRADLAEKCAKILAPMSFAPLYNPEKRLLCVSLEVQSGKQSENCYDLFASEARSASYAAISRGDVPLKHWRALSRALAEFSGCRGMVSWTGSMFEYLMPALFFTSQNGSLLRESERLCVAAQRARSSPWGTSEGAYYSLDASLNYRYAPHGCAALALSRGMDEERVITPYASFLALSVCPEAAVKNLRRLDALGLGCSFGLWEALDMTRGRDDAVRCVMAHHLGMSLVACCNALRGGIMAKRLLKVPEYAAFSSLLEERLPQCPHVIKRRKHPEKAPRSFPVYWERRDVYTDFTSPVCCLLSNGVYNVMLTDSGTAAARCSQREIYLPARRTLDLRHGIDLYLLRGDEVMPLLPRADMPKSASNDWQFSLSGAKLSLRRDEIRAQILFFVSAEQCGEKRVISLSSESGDTYRAQLLVSLEPLLAPYIDYVNHPAYCKLGMQALLMGDSLIVRRLPRGEAGEVFLCLALSEKAQFFCSRRRGGMQPITQNEGLGFLRDGLITAQVPVTLSPDGGHTLSLALAVGETAQDAYFAAQKILTESGGSSDYLTGLAVSLGMTDAELDTAMETLRTVSFPAPRAYSRRALWRFGISGDLPIIAQPVSEATLPEAEGKIKARAFLEGAGVSYDLVFVCEESGYLKPVSQAVARLAEKYGAARVFTVGEDDDPRPVFAAAVTARERALDDSHLRLPLADTALTTQSYPRCGYDEDGTFVFYVNHSLPPRVWGNMLTNGRFGFFAADCGSGHLWYGNSREYQLTPWSGDAYALSGEMLELNGESLFATVSDEDCRVSFGFGHARWEKPVTNIYVNLSAFVPHDIDARIFLITGEAAQPVHLRWYSDLVLGAVGEPNTGVSISREADIFTVTRQDSPYPDNPLIICTNAEITGFTASREAFLTGKPNDDLSAGEGLGLEMTATLPIVLVCGCDDREKLQKLCDSEAALLALKTTKASWRAVLSRVSIETPLPALDRLANGWLPYQALACRLMGRTAIYQCGGAFGFRDQLQDAVNLILLDPSIARSQILACCAKQYSEGDVMHWWHKTGEDSFGVRTRCSDDLLWLVWAVCEYIDATGDTGILLESFPFLVSAPLEAQEHDRYEKALTSAENESVLTHCRRALDLVLKRGTGSHGLLKIGSGDWNDGYSAVGEGGEGESVWLTWFFCHVADRFAVFGGEDYREYAKSLAKSANAAWDTDHFLRGYFGDGTPLGAENQRCCKIDSTSQSFAALCPYANPEKVDIALSTAVSRLYDRETGLVKLLDPPFENASPYPGYIESYGPGFRENGGQYTHGAIFLIYALLKRNRPEEAVALIKAILPASRNPENYAAEPFVIAADVSSNPAHSGEAGWSWYTGSAGWLWRVVLQELLGVHLKNGELTVSPCLPTDWQDCAVTLKTKNGETRRIKLPPAPPEPNVPQNDPSAQI